jgi:tRNA pseudouridine38/39 synthase
MGMKLDQSIEKAIFEALVKTKLVDSRESSGFSRCGRTDKGVSAAGQVVALQLKSAFPLNASFDEDGSSFVSTEKLPNNSSESLPVWVPPKTSGLLRTKKELREYPYERMLNNTLPNDIRILGWCPVSNDFSARFSATTRTYRYFFLARDMDLVKMEEALQILVGQHDFRNFCKMDVEKVCNFERKIHSARLIKLAEHSVCYIQIVGQAFLWHQIRCIASILFLVGRGLEQVSIVNELLDVRRHPGKPSYALAPERPLVLHDCGYPNLQFGHSANNLWTVTCQLEQRWQELILAAARVRNCIESIATASVTRDDVVTFATAKLRERRKKWQKIEPNLALFDEEELKRGPPGGDELMPWGNVVEWLRQWNCTPEPDAVRETIHKPLLDRAKGTTYDEKVDALQKSAKRRQKYEENVIKKRKSAEEDAAFYEHMTKQGGSGL